MSTPGRPAQLPEPGSIRCPRCSSPIGPEQDWCLECGAPARTRLAPTPNWQLPTVAIGTMVAVAGALLAFAFVKLTGDDGGVPVGAAPTAVVGTSTTAPTTPTPGATTAATGKRATSAAPRASTRSRKATAKQAKRSGSAARTTSSPEESTTKTATRPRTTTTDTSTSRGIIPANVPKPPP